MQRREQQRRTASSGGSSYLGGGMSNYSPVPQRFDAPETAPTVSRINTSSPATRSPAFKGSGMKLGTKKTKQAELLDALGGDVLASGAGVGELSGPPTPVVSEPQSVVQKDTGRGSLPEVEAER
jgi:coatomer subunit delta